MCLRLSEMPSKALHRCSRISWKADAVTDSRLPLAGRAHRSASSAGVLWATTNHSEPRRAFYFPGKQVPSKHSRLERLVEERPAGSRKQVSLTLL